MALCYAHEREALQRMVVDSKYGGFEKISGGARRSFLVILVLRWATAPKLDSDMMCGVGIKPSR